MQHNVLKFHEQVSKLKIPRIKNILTKVDNTNSPKIEDVSELTRIIYEIYSLYFHFYKKTINEYVDEISSFVSQDGEFVNVIIIREPSKKTPNSFVVKSKVLEEVVSLISPEVALRTQGFSVCYQDLINEEKERRRSR